MPIRTCLVTGKKQEQQTLLRFTIQDGVLTFDTPDKIGAGRGGYVMNDPAIVAQLPKMKGKIQYYLKAKNITIL